MITNDDDESSPLCPLCLKLLILYSSVLYPYVILEKKCQFFYIFLFPPCTLYNLKKLTRFLNEILTFM